MAKRRGCFLRLVLLAVLLLAGAIAAITFLPLTPLKSPVEARLSETLGRQVTVDSLHFSLTNGPCLAIAGMTAREDHAFGEGIFLRADDVRADFDLMGFLRTRQIVIKALTMKSPQIQLVKNSDSQWNWTTLGRQSGERAVASQIVFTTLFGTASSIARILLGGDLSAATLREIRIENASVKVIDRTRSETQETLYKNIALHAFLSPPSQEAPGGNTRARGDFTAQSEEDGQGEPFRAALPFDLTIERQRASGLSVSGSVGPGPLETRNLTVGSFAINGQIKSETGAPLTGAGRISGTDMFLRTINLSQQLAAALKVKQIGDMQPGSGVSSLETAFQISQDTIHTSGLRLQQIDGLGDASAENGSFKIESALTLNYAATITLSADATSRVKSASTLLGVLATIFETNNRVSVPINITGDVRHPRIEVDVTRIF